MIELNCKYPVIYKDNIIVYTPDENGATGSTYPGAGTSYKEFDTYSEVKAYIDKHNLVYEKPKYSE